MTKALTDFPVEGTFLGNAAIDFRQNSQMFNAYILNSKGDGWFRKCEGITKGYGICLVDVTVTSSIPRGWIVGKVYNVKITYYRDRELIKELGWLFVHNDYKLEDVIYYIRQNSYNWRE